MPEEIIRTEGLTKSYDGHTILRDINMVVEKGAMVLIEGRSGTGKTTLLNIIGCMDSPSSGHLWIDGEDVSKMGHKKLASLRLHKIGFIFQDHNLIDNLTVEENIMLPMKIAHRKDTHRRTAELLETFDITSIGNKKPKNISGGEKQRAAIARALANEPDILLADEPTASLDQENAEVVVAAFKKSNTLYESTIIVASHDPFLKDCYAKCYTIRSNMLFNGRHNNGGEKEEG
ncbi:MAG: ABC transporter ATP-binding protein [Candidatus Thermoplasmatota archaeon]|nr:ABC transporter ATP-binding protein [Candidatus Thermoplasmatota archaeon]